jgi:hypothetical protein
VTGALAITSPFASAATVPANLRSKFVSIDTVFGKVDSKWTTAVAAMPTSATIAQIAQVSPPFVAALKVFDTKLLALGLPGKAGTDAKAVASSNGKLVSLLSSLGNISRPTFISDFRSIFTQDMGLQTAFAKDLGIPTADVLI